MYLCPTLRVRQFRIPAISDRQAGDNIEMRDLGKDSATTQAACQTADREQQPRPVETVPMNREKLPQQLRPSAVDEKKLLQLPLEAWWMIKSSWDRRQ